MLLQLGALKLVKQTSEEVDSTGTPYGLIAIQRTWSLPATPERLTWSALAPCGTVTKSFFVRLRSTVPDWLFEYDGATRSLESTTVRRTRWSTTGVAGSSISRIAECAPGALVRALTGMSTVSPLGIGRLVVGSENVPSLPTRRRACATRPPLPLVRVALTT